jgi:hypothetical protein
MECGHSACARMGLKNTQEVIICVAGQGSCIAVASRKSKAYVSITSLFHIADASDQSASRCCNRCLHQHSDRPVITVKFRMHDLGSRNLAATVNMTRISMPST